MADTEKLLRLKILKARLRQAEEQAVEAEIERVQRARALREQDEQFEYNQARRAQVMEEVKVAAEFDKQSRRPSSQLYTEIYFDDGEDKWACRYHGVVAYGDTPEMAYDNFDHLWMYGK